MLRKLFGDYMLPSQISFHPVHKFLLDGLCSAAIYLYSCKLDLNFPNKKYYKHNTSLQRRKNSM